MDGARIVQCTGPNSEQENHFLKVILMYESFLCWVFNREDWLLSLLAFSTVNLGEKKGKAAKTDIK